VGALVERPAYVELNFRPNVSLVSVVRRFVSDFYSKALSDADGTSRVALATHELLENAVKYSKDGETTIRIQVSQGEASGHPKRVLLQLTNRADAKNVAAMREILDGISKAEDAFTYYSQLIAIKAKRKEPGGLGLARICAEGEMVLTIKELGGDLTMIEATTSIGEPKP
jgi:two-component sensor histidine kinase